MDVEKIVGEIPVFINHDYKDGLMGRAHIRMRTDSPESTITITIKSDAAQALANMMLHYTPIGLSFVYTKNHPSERNDQ